MKKYFVDLGNGNIYLKARFVSIADGMLRFHDEDYKLIREFKNREVLYFGNLLI